MSLFPVVHTRMLGTYLPSHRSVWVFLVGLIGLLLTETSMAITSSKSQSVPATFVYSDVDTTAQLMGRVLNEAGIAVVGANIRLNDYVGTYTDSSGLYIIKGIESGEYKLQISHIGYVEYQRTLEFIPKDKVFIEVRLESKPYENGTIVVTASRTQEALSQVSVPMIVVPKREIQQSGNLRLSDVLSEQLGLYLVENHGTGLQMQGFDPEYTLILIDNQPVIGRTAGTLNLSRLAVGNIEQVEVVKGPSSALWGSDALAGVINIITDKGSKPFEWGLNTRYGTHNTKDISGQFNFKEQNLQARFFGNLNGSNGYDLNPETVAPTIPKYTNYTLQSGVKYQFQPGLSLDISGRYYREDQSFQDVILDRRRSFDAYGTEFQQDYYVSPTLKYAVGSVHLIEASAYWGYFESESVLNLTDSNTRYFSDAFAQRLNKVEFKASTFWDNSHTTILGAGSNTESLDAEIYAEVPGFASTYFYGQHDWRASDDYSLTLGFRYDNHSEYASQLSPKLSTRWKLTQDFSLKASFGGGYKAPDFRQLFLNFSNPISGYSVFGTSTLEAGLQQLEESGQLSEIFIDPSSLGDIRAERAYALNIGADWFATKHTNIRFNAFRNQVRDLIETQRIAQKVNNQSVFSYLNIRRMYSQGIDLELRTASFLLNNLDWSIGGQLLDTRQRITEEFDDVVDGVVVKKEKTSYVPMFNRSRYTGNLKLFYASERLGLDANIRVQYRGAYGFVDLNGNNRIDSRETVNGYTIINSSLAKTFKQQYRIQIGINNVTNVTDPQRLPSNPGRILYAQVSLDF